MKINVTENKVSIKEEQILNENEYNIHKIQFDFSSEYTDDLVKVALFSIDNHTYKKIISNNECDIPPEVLTQRGYSILGVYAYKTEQDTLVLRYSPSPTRISVYDGSYKADAENSEPITPSEIEQYQQILQNSLQQFQNQYNALVEETEGDIQAIEDELQRKVDEGYFDGEDGFSPIAKVIQKSNGATIEIEDKNGKTTADVLNGEDGYTPVRGVDYWTEEDKQEVKEEATQQIEGKIEEYNENAAEKLNQYNQNSVQKTNDYNTNAEQKMSAYNTNATEKTSTYNLNATEKFNNYNSNAEQKETNYNTNASQKVESFNTNASSKLSEYNLNAETKKTAYDENAAQKTTSFNTNATNKLTEYNTNHTEKMSTYNNNSTEKLNAFNENATQKTEEFDEHTEQIQTDIEALQTENARLKATLPTTTGEGKEVTLNKTAELEFKKPPLPMGNSEQESTTGRNLLPTPEVKSQTINGVTISRFEDGTITIKGTPTAQMDVKFNFEESTFSAGSYIHFRNNFSTYNFAVSFRKDGVNKIAPGLAPLNNIYQILEDITVNQMVVLCNNDAVGTAYDITLKPSIELTNEVTEYEKYTNGASPNPDYPQEITNVTGDVEVKVQNKNLFDIKNYSKAGWNITIDNPLKGLSAGNYTLSTVNKYITANKGMTIYFSDIVNGSMNDKIGEVFVSYEFGNTQMSNTKSITQEQINAKYLIIGPQDILCTQEVLENMEITIEKGSTSTNFVEHKEQILPLTLGNIELCKIGDYQDYFYKESNKWYLHKEIGKVVYDGTETGASHYWYVQDENNHSYQITDTTIHLKESKKGLCNYFIINNSGDTPYLYPILQTGTSYCRFVTYNITGLTSTLEEWKTWLSTHNIIFYYPLETPTNTEITDTTLISQLEAINNAISYEEQTNIIGSSNGSNPIFSVEGYQSTKLVLQDISNAIVALGGM